MIGKYLTRYEPKKDDVPPELGARRIRVVEVDGIDVLRQQREPAVVHRQHSPTERVYVDIPDGEVLEDATCPAWLDRHARRIPELSRRFAACREAK
jgi:hypothetical protein